MEQRLIDANDIGVKTIDRIKSLNSAYAAGWNGVVNLIEKSPTIDPVHAAGACYCRECKHWKRIQHENGECLATSRGVITIKKDTGFCDCGERREQNA